MSDLKVSFPQNNGSVNVFIIVEENNGHQVKKCSFVAQGAIKIKQKLGDKEAIFVGVLGELASHNKDIVSIGNLVAFHNSSKKNDNLFRWAIKFNIVNIDTEIKYSLNIKPYYLVDGRIVDDTEPVTVKDIKFYNVPQDKDPKQISILYPVQGANDANRTKCSTSQFIPYGGYTGSDYPSTVVLNDETNEVSIASSLIVASSGFWYSVFSKIPQGKYTLVVAKSATVVSVAYLEFEGP